jgi:hypothetical protein
MFEFFEVPSQMIGAIGPVAQGVNFDWARQDSKPGLINLNLIIDEEVFFSVFGKQDATFNQQLLSFDQLPLSAFTGGSLAAGTLPLPLVAGSSPIPMVVTATLANGAPAAAYPMNNVGVLASDPLTNMLGNRMKASFAQFLSLRHGGSGFVFGYGSGTVGQNFAVLTSPANPNAPATPNAIPADRPFHSLSYPDLNYTLMRPAALPPSTYTDPQAPATPPVPTYPPTYRGNYIGDPGVRNPSLYQGFSSGTTPASTSGAILVPPAIPLRRLFQPPDANTASNASETGDPYLNKLMPATAQVAAGALPPLGTTLVNNGVVSLFWTLALLPTGVANQYLGSNTTALDNRQHPYFRTEMLEKALNLTTVRTHQYAVWITIGFSGPRSARRPARRPGTEASSWSTGSRSRASTPTPPAASAPQSCIARRSSDNASFLMGSTE